MMNSHTKYLGLLIAGVSAVSLSACSTSHPNAMPSGYTYHRDTYKSPAPPPTSKVTASQRKYMDAAQAEQFRDAVYDLLQRLTYRAGMPPKPIYILAPDPMTTFYANIDNDLRESMRHVGYALSDVPVGSYVFAYDARVKEQPRGYVSEGEPNVELILKVFDQVSPNARMLSEESGWYYIQGAEYLNIKPAHYSALPTRQRIKMQEAGFNEIEEPRTVTQFNTAHMPTTKVEPVSTREQIRGQMLSPPEIKEEMQAQEMQQPRRISRPVDPMPQRAPLAPSNYAPNYDGPTQAVVIDSSGISYE